MGKYCLIYLMLPPSLAYCEGELTGTLLFGDLANSSLL